MAERGRPRHPDILTPRQWEVLRHVREGLTNEQIAQRMGISPDGVKFHVSEIITKLGVRRRREAAELPVEPRETSRPSAMLRWRGPSLRRSRRRGCGRGRRTPARTTAERGVWRCKGHGRQSRLTRTQLKLRPYDLGSAVGAEELVA